MPMATGSRIRYYRKKVGWTLDKLEEKSGVKRGTISALEQRDSERSEFFPAIAAAFGLTMEQLQDQSTDWIDALGDKRTGPVAQPPSGYARDELVDSVKVTERYAGPDRRSHMPMSTWALQLARWFDQIPEGPLKTRVYIRCMEYVGHYHPSNAPNPAQSLPDVEESSAEQYSGVPAHPKSA